MSHPLSKKQVEFISNSTKKWNIAHGPVRSGKTIGSLFAFLTACYRCPDSQIYMFGHSTSSIYENCIKIILETPQFAEFEKVSRWSPGKGELKFYDKTITIIGAKDEGAVGRILGKTISIAYCDEMRLYPDNVIQAIISRLSQPWSTAFITTNPSYPTHIIKQWIDKADEDASEYYALQFMIDDNPFLTERFKEELRNNLSGLFYKRNYLGLWCLAEGAIFDFWERNLYVVKQPPEAANYWIAGIDYGMSNPTSCILIGVSTGVTIQRGKQLWVEDEYFWDIKTKNRQKLVGELAEDISRFLESYSVKSVYIDPSAAALRAELARWGIHCVDADNNVESGIQIMTSLIRDGKCLVLDKCRNLIREIEGYSWDPKAAERGEDKPIKKDDHCVDALRYALASHKVATYQPYKQNHNQDQYRTNQFNAGKRKFGY
jgi:PBSX family phage terminase large subunit